MIALHAVQPSRIGERFTRNFMPANYLRAYCYRGIYSLQTQCAQLDAQLCNTKLLFMGHI